MQKGVPTEWVYLHKCNGELKEIRSSDAQSHLQKIFNTIEIDRGEKYTTLVVDGEYGGTAKHQEALEELKKWMTDIYTETNPTCGKALASLWKEEVEKFFKERF
jgi:hypothetical protein